MGRENKKTVLRTIRLSKGLDELLQKDTNSKRITVGALISIILSNIHNGIDTLKNLRSPLDRRP
jgi:hypothetical protein